MASLSAGVAGRTVTEDMVRRVSRLDRSVIISAERIITVDDGSWLGFCSFATIGGWVCMIPNEAVGVFGSLSRRVSQPVIDPEGPLGGFIRCL